MSHDRSVGRPAAPRIGRVAAAHHGAARGQPSAATGVDAARARWFYCDVLRGRQLWPTDSRAGRGFWFEVGDTMVEVRTDGRRASTPFMLAVEHPIELAVRCWDAGLTVQVRDAASGATLVVTDPFGRRVILVPRATATLAAPATRGEST